MSRKDPKLAEGEVKVLEASLASIADTARQSGWAHQTVWSAIVRLAERRLAHRAG